VPLTVPLTVPPTVPLAVPGTAAGVALVGPAGADTSRLAAGVVRQHITPAGTALRLRGRGRTPHSPAVTDLLTEPVPPGASGLTVLRQALHALAVRARGQPLVLWVEDAHLLDDVSVAVLLQALERRLVFLVATVCTAGAAPTHLVPLWKDGLVERIELAPPGGRTRPTPEPDVSTHQCWTLHLRGRPADAERVARLAKHRAMARQRPAAAGAFAVFLAHHLLMRGRPAAAARYATEAVELLRGRDEERTLVARACQVVAHAVRGDLPAARNGLAALDAEHRPPGPGRSAVARARAWTTAQAGSPGGAVPILTAAAAETDARGDAWWQLPLLHDLARLGCGAPAAAPLGALADRLPGELVTAMADHARALDTGDAAGLDAAARALARTGADLPAAEASAQAAAAHRRRGATGAAAVSSARAQLWAARCQDASTPALAGLVTVLSAREIEIARLAATGAPSRALAQRLGVSVRTVDNHLGRCYAKLGLPDRLGLQELLADARVLR
jgi:DNA-binding CsgD family transcriptional regulator